MFINNIPKEGTQYFYDICIVGSGPAGMVLANELASSGKRICVLEAGTDHKSDANSLWNVDSRGEIKIKPSSRERAYGGTSTTWGGGSAPLDAIDLRQRAYLTHPSEWPLTFSELIPYYKRAQTYGFPDFQRFDAKCMAESIKSGDVTLTKSQLDGKTFIKARSPWNFGKKLRYVFDRPNVDLYMDATALNLSSEKNEIDDVRVKWVNIKSSTGIRWKIAAESFIISAGGLESTRLLLLSNDVCPQGLGNENDQVGRYLMNHPKNDFGFINLKKPIKKLPYLFGSSHGEFVEFAGLRVPEETQQSLGILNSYVRIEPYYLFAKNPVARLCRRVVQKMGFHTINKLVVRNFMEMEPRPENRMTLADSLDANGQKQPCVTINTSELDRKSMLVLHQLLGTEMEKSGIGTLESNLEKENSWPITTDASHHLGGTRMGSDPKTSVVDTDLRVHSVENLYISSGSVFPTCGGAHPTYTICALSIRLADTLKSKYEKKHFNHWHRETNTQ